MQGGLQNKALGLRACVTSSFRGVRDGEVYPVQLEPGQIISGDLAASAIQSGHAVPDGDQRVKADAALPFPTGPVKKSASARPVPAKKAKTLKKPKAAQKS